MSSNAACDIDEKLLKTLHEFRFRKSTTNAALILKIDKDLKVVEDTLIQDIEIETIQDELPESSPRFILISFELQHSDGRVSYPLVGIYYNPSSTSTQQRMMYASTCSTLFQKADVVGKVFDLTDAEHLTLEWLKNSVESSKTRP